ncbi:hypothetical protein VP01_1344g1 [Puccinia sorghi]|uniref:Uncharacterized protein n=1 Tax=Puccinia sorghi TaxID=27349 RepID=A0A0L6VMU1_9BASI|nr:hypothetical protein VP01_1344g1 [Puccinia sorghi]
MQPNFIEGANHPGVLKMLWLDVAPSKKTLDFGSNVFWVASTDPLPHRWGCSRNSSTCDPRINGSVGCRSKNQSAMLHSGNQKSVGQGHVTRAQAFERVAEYMNIITSSVHLTGPQMQHRLDTYKGKYCKAKHFKRSTGAGIEEQEGLNFLKQKLKLICPCFGCSF